MSREARAATVVPLAPEGVLALWTDLSRWPSFVEGFARELERSGEWPAEGSRVVWESGPGGRGRVTERVLRHGTGRFETRVNEDALQGRQSLSVSEDAEGTRVELTLDYELTKYGPLRTVADMLFIRRALRDALRRTLRRFAIEAEEDAGLR